jgi:hypothetical protein
LPSYPKFQSGIKLLLYAAPHNPKFTSKEMHDYMIANPAHKFLTDGPLLDNAKHDIIFENTRRYFLSSHDMCKRPMVVKLFYCGSIPISYNMAWASIICAIESRDQQARLLKLHTKAF